MINHVVLIKAKEGVSDEQVTEAYRDLEELKNILPGITGFKAGKNLSPENRAQGYTHGFVMSFADQDSLNAYLPHPEHSRAATKLRECMEQILVIDI